ncbi:MAG: hypothetical protein IJ736_14040 [Firmicutes bacterium]|nr:hypothetical protein [Bacillota bacterium]
MLRILDCEEVVHLNSIRDNYPDSKILFLITDMSDMSDIKGKVYAVSESRESFDEICELSTRLLKEKSTQNVLIGNYKNGGGIGVQFEVKE